MKKRILSVIMALVLILSALPLITLPQADASGVWVAAWGSSIVNGEVNAAGVSLRDYLPARSTVRIEIPVTTGGAKLRFRFSNEYGKTELVINEASVARTEGEGKATVKSNSAVPITFGGYSSISIPVGQTIWSDDIAFSTSTLEKISVSLYFKDRTYITSTGLSNGRTFLGKNVSMSALSSQVFANKISSPSEVNITSGKLTYHTIPFLSNVDTFSEDANACSAVFIGDSTLVNNTYLHFAERLVDAGINNISVVNEAIIGNKLLSDGTGIIGNLYGESLLERFTNDALNITGVKYVFVKIGINDVLHQYTKSLSDETPKYSPGDIIEGYKTLVRMARARGVKIFFFTKSQWKGYTRDFLGQKNDIAWSAEAQSKCDALDEWIRNNDYADGYIDCAPLANPADTYALCPSFTIDGIHLSELASVALADLIPVSTLGISQSAVRTAAIINNVDPYAEKRAIIESMRETVAPTEKTTEKATDKTTDKTTDKATDKATEKTTDSKKDSPSVDISGIGDVLSSVLGILGLGGSNSSGDSKTTVTEKTTGNDPTFPGLPETPSSSGSLATTVIATDVSDASDGALFAYTPEQTVADGQPDQIGGSSSILVVLLIFLFIIIAAVVVLFTVGKKKDEFVN